MKGFPTLTPADLEDRPRRQQWLVDGLWARQAVGIVGGEPKCGKSFLALELADDGEGPALRLRRPAPAEAPPEPETPERRILQALANADAPLSQRQIRERAATRPATVAEALHKLIREGRVERVPEGGYRIAAAGPVNGGGCREPLPKTVTAPNP